MDPKLTEAAKVILREKFNGYTRAYEAFLKDSNSITGDKDLCRIIPPAESDNVQPDDFLWAYAVSKQCVDWIDWKGEYEQGQLQRFLDRRLQALGRTFDWKFLDVFEKSINLNAPRSGDYIIKKFTAIDHELRKQGLLLAMLQRDDDQYHPFLAPVDEFAAISGAQSGITTVTAWADL